MVGQSNVLCTLTPKHVHLHVFPVVFYRLGQQLEERCKLGEELDANNNNNLKISSA